MIAYPARYKPDKINGENAYFLQFIDLPNAFTQGYILLLDFEKRIKI
jgi:hypothetical protein